MASTREVQNALKNFRSQIKKATKEIEDTLETVRDLEKNLDTWDADADLEITRGLKSEIDRGKDEISELRKAVDKLEREISDTNRKFANLAR